MTAAELVTHPEFAAFCAVWQEQGRCPLPFADWLRDRGMDGQAAGAEWAATYRARREFPGRSVRKGPTPLVECRAVPLFCWWRTLAFPEYDRLPACVFDALPVESRFRGATNLVCSSEHDTFTEAIAAFLDAWAVAGHKYRPRRKQVSA